MSTAGPDRGGDEPVGLPTMRDVADSIGVSRQLVSLVMRGAPGPSAASRQRILAAAEALGYRPNASARLLRQRRTHLLGALFALRNPFEVRVIEQLEGRAAAAGYGLVLGARSEERPTDVVVSQLMGQRVEGLVAFNPDPTAPALQDAVRHVPVAWLGERASTADVDNVRVDEVTGLRSAVEHLVGLGHARIAYVGGEDSAVGRDREDAYRAAMTGAGLGEHVEVVASDFSEEGGAAAARTIASRAPEDRPTALVCCGDLNATGVLAVFARSGVAVPGDVSVVGFDDSYVAGLSYHDLTSVRQDVDATVDATLGALVRRIEDPTALPQEILTPTVLVRRGSTAPPRR